MALTRRLFPRTSRRHGRRDRHLRRDGRHGPAARAGAAHRGVRAARQARRHAGADPRRRPRRDGDRLRARQARLRLPRARSAHAARRPLPHHPPGHRQRGGRLDARSRPSTKGSTTTRARCGFRTPIAPRSTTAASCRCRSRCSSTTTKRPTCIRRRRRRWPASACASREVRADMGGYAAELLSKAISTHALDAPLTGDDQDGADRVPAPRRRARRAGRPTRARRGAATPSPPGAGDAAGTPSAPLPLGDLLGSKTGLYLQGEYLHAGDDAAGGRRNGSPGRGVRGAARRPHHLRRRGDGDPPGARGRRGRLRRAATGAEGDRQLRRLRDAAAGAGVARRSRTSTPR